MIHWQGVPHWSIPLIASGNAIFFLFNMYIYMRLSWAWGVHKVRWTCSILIDFWWLAARVHIYDKSFHPNLFFLAYLYTYLYRMFILGPRVETFLSEMIDLLARPVTWVFKVPYEHVFSFSCSGYSFELFWHFFDINHVML